MITQSGIMSRHLEFAMQSSQIGRSYCQPEVNFGSEVKCQALIKLSLAIFYIAKCIVKSSSPLNVNPLKRTFDGFY